MITSINIDNLKLSLDNPRLTDSQNELEEIEKMLSDQGKKLLNLAEDIIENGLNPLDIIAVYPSIEEKGKYIVAEGNRRVTAIKLLNNPELIKGFNQYMYNGFRKLVLKYEEIHTLPCVIFKSSSDKNLIHWIEIKHQGENEGRGTASWSSTQKARFEKKVLGENILLDFWEELEKMNILTSNEILEITKTNWERILREYRLGFFGLKKSRNHYVIPIDDIVEFKKKMRLVYEKLRNQTVGIVYDQEKIEKFFDDVSIQLYGHKYNSSTNQINLFENQDTTIEEDKLSHTGNIILKDSSKQNYSDSILENTESSTIQITSPPIQSKKEKKDIFYGSKTVIPKGYKMSSTNIRINKIIRELKSLDCDEYPNACGMLLRILFELSAKAYFEMLTDTDQTKMEFQAVINKVSNDLFEKNKINRFEKSAINNDVELIRNLFNGCAHDTDCYPSSESIRNIFKAHLKFIKACLDI